MDRKDFFFRQRVTQSELDDAFLAAEVADQRITSDILGEGFLVSGPSPATVVENTVPDLKVLCNQFLGYDQIGRRLSNLLSGFQGGVDIGAPPPQDVDMSVDELGAATTVTTPGNEKTLTIFVEFGRNPSDPRLDGNAATVNFEQDESISFNIVQSAEAGLGLSVPPPARADQLILADVVRIFGQTSFLNADIDQSRREDFQFGLIHGSTHVSTGSDPIPDAVAAGASGLFSGADQTKLDAVDFSDSGVGALFNTQAKPFNPANASAPATTTLDVTGLMAGKSAGGSSSVEGVVTQSGAPNNRVVLQNDDFDDFTTTDSDDASVKVFGRITVDNEGTPTVWTLSFFIQDNLLGEVAFDMTPFAAEAIVWYVQETFLLQNVPTFDPAFSIPSDQVTAEIIDGTEAAKGKVQFAPDGGTNALEAVQGNDTRLGGAGNVPVGAVMAWMSSVAGAPLPTVPSGYEYCDGTAVTTVGSPLLTRIKPALMITPGPVGTLRMLRGADVSVSAYGGANALVNAGADTHGHGTAGHSHGDGFSIDGESAHTHGITSEPDHDHSPLIGGAVVENAVAAAALDPDGGHNHGGNTAAGSSHSHGISGSVNTGNAAVNSGGNIPGVVQMAFIIRVV